MNNKKVICKLFGGEQRVQQAIKRWKLSSSSNNGLSEIMNELQLITRWWLMVMWCFYYDDLMTIVAVNDYGVRWNRNVYKHKKSEVRERKLEHRARASDKKTTLNWWERRQAGSSSENHIRSMISVLFLCWIKLRDKRARLHTHIRWWRWRTPMSW